MDDAVRVREQFPGATMTQDEMAGSLADGPACGYLVWSARQHGYLLGKGLSESAAWADAVRMVAQGQQRVLSRYPKATAVKLTPRKDETRYVVWSGGVRQGTPVAVGDSERAAWAAAASQMSHPVY
jgi:hypothetical protein